MLDARGESRVDTRVAPIKRDIDLACQLLHKLANETKLALSDADRSLLRDVSRKLEQCPVLEAQVELDPASPALRATLWSDGACRGNPGLAGVGAIIKGVDGKVLATVSEFIGKTTNNVAEYRALIRGAEAAKQAGVTVIEVRADSQLMIEQLKGNYAVKNEGLKVLYKEAKQVLQGFQRVVLQHVPRAENAEADELANLGIDSR